MAEPLGILNAEKNEAVRALREGSRVVVSGNGSHGRSDDRILEGTLMRQRNSRQSRQRCRT